MFPDSIETEYLCKSEENPGHAHPPLFPPPYQDIFTNYPLPFITQFDNFKLIKPPVGPSVSIYLNMWGMLGIQEHLIFQVLRLSESVVPDCTYLIKARSSGGMFLIKGLIFTTLTSYIIIRQYSIIYLGKRCGYSHTNVETVCWSDSIRDVGAFNLRRKVQYYMCYNWLLLNVVAQLFQTF